MRFDTDGEIRSDFGHGLFDVLAERKHVSAGPHRDADPDRRLAVKAEHRLRWIGISTLDGRDVGQSVDLSVGDKIDVSQIGLRAKSAGHVHPNLFVGSLNDACGRHGVLCLNGLNQCLSIEVKAGNPV